MRRNLPPFLKLSGIRKGKGLWVVRLLERNWIMARKTMACNIDNSREKSWLGSYFSCLCYSNRSSKFIFNFWAECWKKQQSWPKCSIDWGINNNIISNNNRVNKARLWIRVTEIKVLQRRLLRIVGVVRKVQARNWATGKGARKSHCFIKLRQKFWRD